MRECNVVDGLVRALVQLCIFIVTMNYKETRMLGVLSTKGNPAAMADIKALLNSLVVVDMRSIKVREIGLQAGYAKTEVRVVLRALVQVCTYTLHGVKNLLHNSSSAERKLAA